MTLQNNITIYGDVLQELVDYVNKGWRKNYTIQDVVGFELGKNFMFVHFNKDDFTKDAYPINFTLTIH
jgi:hypothetical protein